MGQFGVEELSTIKVIPVGRPLRTTDFDRKVHLIGEVLLPQLM